MCCFSQPVISVSATNIFARPDTNERQFLVYSMTVHAENELAMVLPLPVKIGAEETDVSFIDLNGYPDFFADLIMGFPEPKKRGFSLGLTMSASKSVATPALLQVVRVGNFEASFVPTMKDFSRLDERFRIPDTAWKKLPGYHDFGFAVFKLKPGEAKVHPMALSFPRRDEKSVFFPTVHIHDGEVHRKAEFDHTLYCQPGEHEHLTLRDWRESDSHAKKFMQLDKSKGLILAGHHCYQKKLHGNLPNQDTRVLVTT